MDAQDTKDLTKEAVALSLDNELDYNRMIIDLVTKSPAHFLELIDGDALALAHKLLKIDPAMYCVIARQQIVFGLDCEEIKRMLMSANVPGQGTPLIAAIKKVREKTGLGLKEAKDVCELLIVEMQKRGMYDPTPRNTHLGTIDSKMQLIISSLIKAL
jgi:hypothetical protein